MKTLLFALLLGNLAHAFLYPKTAGGRKIKWAGQGSMNFYVNPQDSNSSGISSLDVQTALEESVEEWNSVSPVKLNPIYTSNLPTSGSGATLQFSSNPAFFGSGVLAVTSVSYNNSTGAIYSADILMNDTGFISTDFTDSKANSGSGSAYVGDVITHEIGHLLGLNHSEVPGASMVFSIFKNQFDVHSDDIHGIGDLYSKNSATGISGKVVGEGFIPVFGAHVQAINLEDNIVAAGVFAEEDGSFSITGLEPGKGYALYVTPIRSKENLPSYFSNFDGAICDGNDFAPSFFSKCGGSNAGRAQVINPSASEMVDVGYVGVKCATSIDPEYLRQKVGGDDEFVFFDHHEKYKTNETFTGYFTEDEILSGEADKLKIDLSGMDTSALGTAYLKINLSFKNLASSTTAFLGVKREDESSYAYSSPVADPVTNLNPLDYTVIKELSSDADDNILSIQLIPASIGSTTANENFGAPYALTNDKAIYLVSAQVVFDPFGQDPVSIWNDYPYEDNSRCLEGTVAQSATAYNPINSMTEFAEQEQPISCGTVDFDGQNGPGSGMGSFALGLLLVCGIFALRPRLNDFFV